MALGIGMQWSIEELGIDCYTIAQAYLIAQSSHTYTPILLLSH
jgi:hypothetical protein